MKNETLALFTAMVENIASLNGVSAATAQTRKFAVAPIVGKDGAGASTLGGYNDAINVNSPNKATAKDFRTWGGTLLAAEYLAEAGVADTEKCGTALGHALEVRAVARDAGDVVEVLALLDQRLVVTGSGSHLRVGGKRGREQPRAGQPQRQGSCASERALRLASLALLLG